jgi:hypothetical protein
MHAVSQTRGLIIPLCSMLCSGVLHSCAGVTEPLRSRSLKCYTLTCSVCCAHTHLQAVVPAP